MSGIHGVFQHRTGYYYTILEEDFCEIFKGPGKSEVCRAYIASIFEQLTNKQFNETSKDTDIWVFMSIPEIMRRMRNAYKERTIHKELQGMVEDGYLEKRRSRKGGATMEYKLNIKKIREELASLPDKQASDADLANLQDQREVVEMQDDLANLQDHSGKIARSSCKNDSIDLAKLQPRIREDIPEIKQEEKENKEPIPLFPEKTKRKPAKEKADTELQARINHVFEAFDTFLQEVTEDDTARYSRSQKAKEAIKELLDCNPTESNLKLVYFHLWNTPASDTFSWRDHMTIPAICRNYDKTLASIRGKKQPPKSETPVKKGGSLDAIVAENNARRKTS